MTLYEANATFGGQVALAATSERRRDLIGIVDWRVAECRRLGVQLRRNHYADADEVTDVDVVIVATGGVPNTSVGVPGDSLAIDSWDLLAGAAKPTGDVLVYDDHGGHQALDAVEALTRTARSVEYVTPERSIAPDVGASPAVGYFQMLADNDVRTTVLHRLVEIEKRDRRLAVRLQVEGAKTVSERTVDTVVIEHGTVPDPELFDALTARSVNLGEIVRPICWRYGLSRPGTTRTGRSSSIESETPSRAATFPRRFSTPTGCATRSEHPHLSPSIPKGKGETHVIDPDREERPVESIKHLAIDTAESSAAFKRRFMWRLLAVLIGGMLLDGYILGIIGPVTGSMKEDLGMSTWEMSLVASMALFGILIGSPLGGWAGDKWGRKPLFMIDMALFVVGSILQFFVGSFEMLLVVRLLMGIAIGAEYSVGWPLMSEFSPKELRGRLMATTVLAWYADS